MAGPLLICPPCATGDCSRCRVQVTAGRVTKACTCRHGAAPTVVARSTDPSTVASGAGSIVSVHDGADGALVDTSRAVILEGLELCHATNPSDGVGYIAALLSGHRNRTSDHLDLLFVVHPEIAALLVAELLGLAARMGPVFEAAFRTALDGHLELGELWPDVVPAGGGDA